MPFTLDAYSEHSSTFHFGFNWFRLFAQMIIFKWWYLLCIPYQFAFDQIKTKVEKRKEKKQFQQEHTLLYCSLLQIKITSKWLFNTLRGRQCNKRQHIWPVHVIYDYNIIWACLSIVNGICSILRFIRKAKGVKNVAKGNTTFTIFQVRCRHSKKTSGWMNKKKRANNKQNASGIGVAVFHFELNSCQFSGATLMKLLVGIELIYWM